MLLLVGCCGGGCVCSLGPAFELAITASSTPVDTEVTLFRTKLHRCRMCSTVQAPVVAGKLTGAWYKAGGPAVVDSQDAVAGRVQWVCHWVMSVVVVMVGW
jgi:hypothetical protein